VRWVDDSRVYVNTLDCYQRRLMRTGASTGLIIPLIQTALSSTG
jgi:hypothetical protein